jgi:two-component system, LytTR family, response regulator
MINTLIVEDEDRSSKVLEKMLSDYCPEIKVSGIAGNINEARRLIRSEKPKLVFLDIQLPDGNSFSLLNDLNTVDFRIIFTTAYNDYALKALKCSALDYLLKPVNIDELIAAIDKFKTWEEHSFYSMGLKALQDNMVKESKEKIKTIGLGTLNEIQFVATDTIIRLEAASNYTHFYIEGMPRVTVSHTLKHYEDILDHGQFMRVHQSHIINLRKVKKYIKGKTGSIMMTDGCTIDVSPKNKEDFLKALNWG